MVDRAESSDSKVLELLARHPKVQEVRRGDEPGVRFSQGPWTRRVTVGDPGLEVAGLVELIDNNPLVCADEASVPDPASTLALLALGPLAQAGLITDVPVMQCTIEADASLLDAFIRTASWESGLVLDTQTQDLSGGAAATLMAPIRTPERLEDLDDLYEEAYGHSFFVRKLDEGDWHVGLVLGTPNAAYRLRITPGDGSSLLTVLVMADLQGKCGAAQVIHAMNVMAGFEETIGIA